MRLLTRTAALVFAFALVCLGVSPAAAEQELDSVKADPAHHKAEFENDQVRVVRYVISPHDKTAPHSHPSLVNILLTDANAKVTTPDGKNSEIQGKAGTAAWQDSTTHVVENIGGQPIEGILVEPKRPGSAAWIPPAQDSVKTDPETHTLEFENDQVRVVRLRYRPGEKSRMHDHPDQVQIWLTDANVRVNLPDGKTREDHPKAGLVRWRNAFSHTAENIGDKTFEGISVELKGAPPAKNANK